MTLQEAIKQKEIEYRGYSIVKEATRAWRISFYANGLQTAKQIIDWMISQGCLEAEEKTKE